MRLLHMELNRIGRRPTFWLLIAAGFILALVPVIEGWPRGLTGDSYMLYPRSAYVSWMYFESNSYHIYGLILPLLAALSYADAYAEDFNTGLIKGILTKVAKKKYLLIRYTVNFLVGGFVVMFPVVVNFMANMAAFPLIDNHPIYGMPIVSIDSFWPSLFYQLPLIYIIVRMLLLFLLGGMLASLGLALSTVVKNRYVVLVFPFLVFMGLDVITATLNAKYSIYSLYIGNVQSNWLLPSFLSLGIVGSFIWYYIAGGKNETI